ncbi:MAG: protein kinase domain-containing protein [Planctomycetia bacterium]
MSESEPTQTIPDFLKVLKASGLVPADALAPIVAAYFDEQGPVPESLVQALLEKDLVTEWQLAQLRKGKSRGFTLGKYVLRRLIGAGGMGSVYLARHTTLGGEVAIKILPTKRVNDGSYLERFKREAQAAARLRHPNIAHVIDLDSMGAIHFMVMEYVDGVNLHTKVKQEGVMHVADAVDAIRQSALGLQHAHEHGFVHRDIKPANLMLDIHGTIKVLDLGLAKAASDDDEAGSLTMEFREKTLGTADFVAPEQAADSHSADRRADIYSLGCTLYYLLVGKAPFAAGSIKDRLKAQAHTKPPSPMDQRPEVPADLTELYFRLMEKSPQARPQTAQEVADTLQAWLTKHGGPQRQSSQPQGQSVVRRSGRVSSVVRRGPPSGIGTGVGPQGGLAPGGMAGQSGVWRPGSDPRLPPTPRPSGSAPNLRTGGAAAGTSTVAAPTETRSTAAQTTVASSRRRKIAWPSWLRLPANRNIAGLPPGLWLLIAGAVVAVIVLAVLVLQRGAK